MLLNGGVLGHKKTSPRGGTGIVRLTASKRTEARRQGGMRGPLSGSWMLLDGSDKCCVPVVGDCRSYTNHNEPDLVLSRSFSIQIKNSSSCCESSALLLRSGFGMARR